MRRGVSFGLGLVAGALLAVGGMVLAAPAMMLRVQSSPHGVEETAAMIKERAEAAGWTVSSITPLDQSIVKHGGAQLPPIRLVNLCQAEHASRVLATDKDRLVSVLMPCTIAVYADDQGATRISTMNAGLMGRVFGGAVAEVMAGPVARDQAAFTKF